MTTTIAKGRTLTFDMWTMQVDVSGLVEDTNKPSATNIVCRQGHDISRTRRPLLCPVCDNRDEATFERGREVSAGQWVIIPEEVRAESAADAETKQNMPVDVHAATELDDLIFSGKTYLLKPTSPAFGKVYALLVHKILQHRGKLVFFTHWASKSVDAWYQLDVYNGALVLKQLVWSEAIRAVPEMPTEFPEAWDMMADAIIEAAVTPFDAGKYVDERAKKMAEYIASQTPVSGAAEVDSSPVVPIVAVEDMGERMQQRLAELMATKKAQEVADQVPADVQPITTAPKRRRAAKKTAEKVSA